MSSVSSWAAALCVAAIVCTAMQMLAPKNGTGRIFRLIAAAFFLICMISPLAELQPLSLPETNISSSRTDSGERLTETVMEQLRAQSEAAILSIAQASLKEKDIFVQKVALDMDMDEQGGIYINGITLYLDKQDQASRAYAAQLMRQELGTDVTIR